MQRYSVIRSHLDPRAKVVECKQEFESAIEKNQAGREENLTNREKDSVRLLPKCNEADSEAEAGSDSGSEDDMAYATIIIF
jgi:hypothetical protein